MAPFVFNCGWLGHGKNSVGGSSLTFLGEHHKNHSRKTAIGTEQMSQTEQQRKAPGHALPSFCLCSSVFVQPCKDGVKHVNFEDTAEGCGTKEPHEQKSAAQHSDTFFS